MQTNHNHTNSLIQATSPYLLQHAHNPVDWNMWSEEIWERAKAENKPVIISIGYSACHWCHVMERESFELKDVAEIMNRHFINVKVDREERPDVDMVYMDACQLMTGAGGWPLHAICLPDGKPIFAGTYFSREKWKSILEQIADLWKNDPAKAQEYGEKVMSGLREMNALIPQTADNASRKELLEMYSNAEKQFDWQYGGRKQAPKFPMPANFEYLLDFYMHTNHKEVAEYLHLSLLRMANGGISDHLRGGFYRYSTDAFWFAPHFEKMLYDNAQLIQLYSRAAGIFKADIYKEIAENCIAFCNQELRHPEGGYYAALDADSEGVEGKYYTFTYPEIAEKLSTKEIAFCEIVFGITEAGNWEHGRNILHKTLSPAEAVEKLQCTSEAYFQAVKSISRKLLEVQNRRMRPGLDNKRLASWNGLMLKGLASAAIYLQEKKYTRDALALANWIWTHLYQNNALYRMEPTENQKVKGFAEDYACVISGFIALYEATGAEEWLFRAKKLTDDAIELFFEPDANVFLFTPSGGEKLLIPKYELSDDVIPSSNSMFCEILQKLGYLFDDARFIQIGESLPQLVRQQTLKYPLWYSNWARCALAEATGMVQLVITEEHQLPLVSKIKCGIPSTGIVAFAKADSQIPALKEKSHAPAKMLYVCVGKVCFEPVANLAQAAEVLEDAISLE